MAVCGGTQQAKSAPRAAAGSHGREDASGSGPVSTLHVYLIGGLIFLALAAVAVVAGFMLNNDRR
jgi:hypothetical protein